MSKVRTDRQARKVTGRLNCRRANRGEAFASVAVGAMVLIMLGYFALDLISLVMVNSINDTLARNAARAAANQQDVNAAGDAANQVVFDFKTSQIVPSASIKHFDYQANQQVTVITSIVVKVPAALPCLPTYVTFQAQDTEAVVGAPATL